MSRCWSPPARRWPCRKPASASFRALPTFSPRSTTWTWLTSPSIPGEKKNNSFLFSHLVDNLSATVDTWWKCIHILIIDLQRQVVAVAQSWMAANRSLFIPPLATKKRSVPEPFGPCYKNIFKKRRRKKLYNGLSVVLKKYIFLCSSAERCNERFSFFSLLLLLFTSVPRPLIDRTRAI